ncbi:class I SAM-dependent methyltransferase [Streptomyces sp. NPDC006356]
MADKLKAELGEVQQTLLIPLYARASATKAGGRLLDDPRAVEMVEAIDFDFTRFDGAGSLIGANLRTLVLDSWVRDFLAEHPEGTVVEIGCGLNTRLERVDNGRVHWFDLDLPDAITLRRTFFTDTDRRTMLSASVTDTAWTDAVLRSPAPHFLVAEAVLPYLSEGEVRQVLAMLAAHFPGALLATDTTGAGMQRVQESHDVLGSMTARMQWICDDPTLPVQWLPSIRHLESVASHTCRRGHCIGWSQNSVQPCRRTHSKTPMCRNPRVSTATALADLRPLGLGTPLGRGRLHVNQALFQ